MDEPACPGCRELLQRVAELEAQVAALTRRLDNALRAGKRQAAPFRKGPPKPDPKTHGRMSGDAHGTHGHRPPPLPEQTAECHEAHVPDPCHHCRGRLVETGTADQFQTDIPRTPLIRKFRSTSGAAASAASGPRAGTRSRRPTPWARPPVRSDPMPKWLPRSCKPRWGCRTARSRRSSGPCSASR
jgi:hypothetical protein